MTLRESLIGLDAATRNQIIRSSEQLRIEFGDRLEPEVVEVCLDNELASLRDSRVKNYVPLLAHRFARERLMDMVETKGWVGPS